MSENYLRNAPLKEVLFEIRWDLDYVSEEKILFDKGFEQAILNFTARCQNDFSDIVLLKPENIPSTAFNHRATHRFFKIKNQHPLYQMGPGVFTINDNNKNYIWSDFLKMTEQGVAFLKNSYNKELVLSEIQLRYVDKVSPHVLGDNDKFDFLKKHMQINPEPYPFVNGELNNIQFSKSFKIDEEFELNLIVSTGIDTMTKEDIIEWHTFVINKKRVSWEELTKWAKKAHDICSSTFKKMISEELYEYFNK